MVAGMALMAEKVPPGHMWVTGDNLPHSTDSRVYGPIPLAMVSGKVVARLWPRPSCWIKNPLADE